MEPLSNGLRLEVISILCSASSAMLQLQKPCRSFNLLGYICTFCRGVAACGLQRMLHSTFQSADMQDSARPGLDWLVLAWYLLVLQTKAIRRFVITAFSWLKAATTASTCKTLLRHYAKQAVVAAFNQEEALHDHEPSDSLRLKH